MIIAAAMAVTAYLVLTVCAAIKATFDARERRALRALAGRDVPAGHRLDRRDSWELAA